MIILAIDPGEINIGFAVIKKGSSADNYRVLDSGLISGGNFKKLADQINLVIKKNKPDILGIEKIYFYLNKKTALLVSERIGALKLIAQQQGLKIIEMSPTEYKSLLTGDGRASKKTVGQIVKMRYKNFSPKSHHEVDALALATVIMDSLKY